jgi:hypothetical protein
MLKSVRVFRLLVCCATGSLGGCGGARAVQPTNAATAPSVTPAAMPAPAQTESTSSASPSLASKAEESPGFAAAMATLRPPAAEAAMQGLASAPNDAEAYAKAALAYAPTDVPGMTLLWGVSYQAMGGGSFDAAVAAALSQVLTERITAKPDEQGRDVRFNLRLAPGQMPARQEADGSVHAPIAHVFEALFGPAVTGFRPPWTIEQFYDVLSTWVGLIASHGTALDERVELNGWLVTLAKAGHLEAFCYRLLGPAFPAELKAYAAKNAAELRAYQEYLKATPLRPKQAYMPDDLVRIE